MQVKGGSIQSQRSERDDMEILIRRQSKKTSLTCDMPGSLSEVSSISA
jgi:hypothetical protein